MSILTYINLPAICLYLIGSVFVLTMFEPDEESGPAPLLVLSVCWPVITIWVVIQEFLGKDKE